MRVRNIKFLGLFLLGLLFIYCINDVDGFCGPAYPTSARYIIFKRYHSCSKTKIGNKRCCCRVGMTVNCRFCVTHDTTCSSTSQLTCMSCSTIRACVDCYANCSGGVGRCLTGRCRSTMPGTTTVNDNSESNENFESDQISTTLPDNKSRRSRKSMNNDPSAVTVAVVSSCVVIVVIAILITVCYWIHKKHERNTSKPKSSTVKYVADNGNVVIKGETCTATQPLPPTPLDNHYIPSTSQQHTYEQIDPAYIGLQQDKHAAGGAYTTLQLNNDPIHNCNSPVTTDISETTNLKTGKNGSKDKSTPTSYTLQRDENSDVTETSHTTDANDVWEADKYAVLRQSDNEEESYTKLNHNVRKSVPDDHDITDDYNKLIPTPGLDEESEEYLNRTSLNVDESVEDTGYGNLNLSIDEAAESTAKPNDGYEETLPGDIKPESVQDEL